MNIVVTGSLGHISKPLTEELVKNGHTVTVISSSPDRRADIETLGAKAAIGSVEDMAFLTGAFTSADAVYCMIPPNFSPPDQVAYYSRIGDNYAQAIEQAGVKRVVDLSSYGAHLAKGTGFIVGSHHVENRLDALPKTSVTHVRPGYFYYNLFGFVGMIKGAGFMGPTTGAFGPMKSTIAFRCISGILLFLFNLSHAHPQAIIQGQVRDASTNDPIPFASVYINASTRGTTANADGQYRLTGVPAGTVDIVASAVGFKMVRQTIRLNGESSRRVDLALTPDANALQTITVRAKRPAAYNRLLKQFKRELLGNTAIADKCLITNVESVVLTVKNGRLEAKAAEPLIIENKALGYRLFYNLTYFNTFRQATYYAGTSRFEVLTPDNPEQADRWERNRQRAYQGSIRHLLTSLIAGRQEQEGFLVYKARFDVPADLSVPVTQFSGDRPTLPVRSDSLFRRAELPSERYLFSAEPLEVFYTRRRVISTPYRELPYAYSILYMPTGKAAIVTTDGWIVRPNGLEVRGAMSDDRLATLLPADWKPANPNETLLATAITAGRPQRPDAGLDSLVALRRRQVERTAPSVYLHTDKALYFTGDQLWVSAYVLDAARLDPTRQLPVDEASNTPLQVELIAPTGRPVQHQWLRITDGRAATSFRLADSLTAGTYRLRAYTAMDQPANGPAFECSVPIYTIKQSGSGDAGNGLAATQTGSVLTPPSLTDALDIQFLPEGGRWVAGTAGRLGIKTLQPNGQGRAVSGRIVDQTGTEVVRFRTNALGMGQVSLTPHVGQRYTALVEPSPNGTIRPVVLPATESEGWALAVDAVSDSSRLTVTVQASDRYSEQPVYITLQSQEKLVYRQKWLLSNRKAQFSVSTATLPPGVCRLTLWDMTNQPRAERLVFVPERAGNIQMRVITAKPRYEAREQVVIGLQFRDAEGYPVTGSWSAAVTDADQLPADTTRPDLRTHLLLTGDLRGRVESPAYYRQPEHWGDLDNLLLTQGWRRLPAPQPTDSLGGWTLSGRVRDDRSRPVANKAVVIQLQQGGQKMLRSLRTDAQGLFRLDGLQITDTVQVRARVLDSGLAGATLTFDAPGVAFVNSVVNSVANSAPVAANGPVVGSWAADARTRQTAWPALYRDSTARQLAEVVVRANKPVPKRPIEVQRSSLHGDADGVLIVEGNDSFLRFNTIWEMMQGRLPGVQVSSNGDVFIRGITSSGSASSGGGNTPLFLLDGSYVDKEVLGSLDLRMVSRIEVLKNPTTAGIYGARGAAGVIAIYTRKGGGDEMPVRNSVTTTMTGFATPREFYVPRYDATTAGFTDRRDVLFWQPLGQNDADGRANLRFPLSDTAKRLRLVIEGLTTEGIPMSFTWLLPVR